MRAQGRLKIGDLGVAADQARDRRTQISGIRVDSTQWRKVRAQTRRTDLEHPHRSRQITQPSRPQIDEINSAEQARGRVGYQDLTAVSGGHHPRSPVEHRAEIVTVPQFGLTGRQPHPHRQLQRSLRSDRSINRRPRRRERGSHTVTGVAEQKPVVPLDRGAQHLVMGGQRHPHRIRVGLPPTGRTLDIGEQKRHHPRRSSRRHGIASAHFMCPRSQAMWPSRGSDPGSRGRRPRRREPAPAAPAVAAARFRGATNPGFDRHGRQSLDGGTCFPQVSLGTTSQQRLHQDGVAGRFHRIRPTELTRR